MPQVDPKPMVALHFKTPQVLSLAGVAQRIECWPMNLKITSSIPSQGTCRVVGQVPSRGLMRGNHTLMFLSLSFSLPFSLKK